MVVVALAAEKMDLAKYQPWAHEVIHHWSEFSPAKYGLAEHKTL